MTETRIRPARPADRAALGKLGADLVRLHHAMDRERFIPPGADPEGGYAWFLETQLARPDVAILVAEEDDVVVGYAYIDIEPHDWQALRDRAGFIHDLIVRPDARGRGIGTLLLEAALAWMRERGAPRVLLWTAHGNPPGEAFFAGHGFRRTMIEMTREL
jgi:GNAT superfamily N-acetyltransferase